MGCFYADRDAFLDREYRGAFIKMQGPGRGRRNCNAADVWKSSRTFRGPLLCRPLSPELVARCLATMALLVGIAERELPRDANEVWGRPRDFHGRSSGRGRPTKHYFGGRTT